MIGKSIALCALTIALASCTGQFKPDGQRELAAEIHDQSHGLIELASYQKTNGVEHDVFGAHIYTVQYEAEIEFTEDCYWTGGPGGHINFSGDFEADKKTLSPTEMLLHGAAGLNRQRAKKGEHVKVVGTLDYQQTDNGWAFVQP